MKCPNCGEDSLVWDGDWETVAEGEVETPILLHYTCEDCLSEFSGVYRLDQIEEGHVDRAGVTCHICGYNWGTDSEKDMVTCPNCQRKTNNTPKNTL